MTALVIDRQTLPETLLPLIGADRVRVERRANEVALIPETDGEEERYCIDPADYPDTTAFLNAIPGFVESIREIENAPDSEWEDIPEEYFNV